MNIPLLVKNMYHMLVFLQGGEGVNSGPNGNIYDIVSSLKLLFKTREAVLPRCL